MTGSERNTGSNHTAPGRFDRRRFLAGAAAVPLLVAIASCTTEKSPRPAVGPDLTGMDPAIRPQDDLYRNVNGTWLRDFRLPADKPSYGAFEELVDRTEERLKTVLESLSGAASGTDEQRLHDIYEGFLDTAARDRAGIAPLADLLGEIERAESRTDLARLTGKLTALGVSTLFQVWIWPDRMASTRHRPYLMQSGLGLPDEAYYREPQYAEQRDAYRGYLERIAQAAGIPAVGDVAARTLELETRIAAGHVDLPRLIESLSSYHPYEWRQLTELAPGFDWDAWLSGLTERPGDFGAVLVDQPGYATAVARVWADTDLAAWRDYLRLRLIARYAPALATPFADAHFDCFDTALQGTRQQPERWRGAVPIVRERLGDALGRQYVDKRFPAATKKLVEELVRDLLAAYRTALSETPWMSEATRRAAVAKVDRVVTVVGHPERWRDYSGLTVPRGSLIAALRAVDSHEFRWELGKLTRPTDRAEWSMLAPSDVNASYSWELNRILLPAGILQPPFFDPEAEPAVNYGGIGMVIAHEMGHGFDSGGSKYDADGTLRDWWTPEDKAAFDAKTALVVDQYDPLVPAGLTPEQHVDGQLTVTENLADLRGLTTALAAFRLAEQRRGVADPDYRPLFLAYARMWRHAATTEYAASLVALDSHSPAEFRVNQVARNMPEFHTAFGVLPADRMYLAPDLRVTM
ncbi:M13 family metallopeptidase [Nocardia crassostreae]|uniref:M13 family metallopeptidase n=1 Tax=Nocardia crassostreae TaxID=53428 RepID=UPI00083371B4|nr:M13 family metallopeptidase [Nocardia crassostreae]